MRIDLTAFHCDGVKVEVRHFIDPPNCDDFSSVKIMGDDGKISLHFTNEEAVKAFEVSLAEAIDQAKYITN